MRYKLKGWLQHWHLSLFEKVILINSLLLLAEALAALWVTSHALESHHFLIDTTFLVLATLLGISINALLLRASFRPLFRLLAVIRAVSGGLTEARADEHPADAEAGELARAFNTMLDGLEQMRREQAALILRAREEELRRIARELHDESSQNLTALLVYCEFLTQTLQALPAEAISVEAREQLAGGYQQLNELAQRTLDNVRALSQQLRPPVRDDLGLLAALRWLAEDCQRRLHLTVDLALDDTPLLHDLPSLYETTLFRIAQESLTNVVRHAQTHRAWLALQSEEEAIVLRVRDEGCGYDPQQPSGGLGILSMRERALLLGGRLTMHSRRGEGTLVEVRLPLPPAPPETGSPPDG